MAQINVAELFKQTRRKLKMQWVAGLNGGSNTLTSETVTKPSLALIGHLNFVHPNRVQVLGCAEMDYLRSLKAKAAASAIENLFSTDLAVVIVANGETVPDSLLEAANSHHTPLFTSTLKSPVLMDILNHFLAHAVAESISLHGVFMEVQGFGALASSCATFIAQIEGESKQAHLDLKAHNRRERDRFQRDRSR